MNKDECKSKLGSERLLEQIEEKTKSCYDCKFMEMNCFDGYFCSHRKTGKQVCKEFEAKS